MMPLAAGASSPVIGPSGSVRLSGVTPGNSGDCPFRRVSAAALTGSSAHAKSDSLLPPPPLPMSRSAVISVLARSFLAGEPAVDGLLERTAKTLGRNWQWLRPLVVRYLDAFAGRTRPRHRDVVQFLLHDEGFRTAHARYRREIQIAEWLPAPSRMQPVAAARSWNIPAIESAGDLAAWLSLEPIELEWLADPKGLCDKLGNASLQHYHYQILPKRSGGIRLTESPKPRLKRSAAAYSLRHPRFHPSAPSRSWLRQASLYRHLRRAPRRKKGRAASRSAKFFSRLPRRPHTRILSNPRLSRVGRHTPRRPLLKRRASHVLEFPARRHGCRSMARGPYFVHSPAPSTGRANLAGARQSDGLSPGLPPPPSPARPAHSTPDIPG